MPYREVTAAGVQGGTAVTRSNSALGQWSDSASDLFRYGSPPDNNDGSSATVTQVSSISDSGVRVSGSIAAATLFSSDFTGTGTVADGLSTLRVILDVSSPTRFTLTAGSSAPVGQSSTTFISVLSRITSPDGENVLFSIDDSGTIPAGSLVPTLSGTLQPGMYQFELNAKPSLDYGTAGQNVAGTYSASLDLAAPAVVPLPPAVLAGGAGLLAVAALRRKLASVVR
jgi:hypothetical protein